MVKGLVVNNNKKFSQFPSTWDIWFFTLFILVFVILFRFWFIKPINANIRDFLSSLSVLVYFMQCFIPIFLYLHDVFFVSFFFFHALLSWPFLGNVAVTCPKQLSFIKLSLTLFYTWLYNRPVLQSLSFASLCYCCFCK